MWTSWSGLYLLWVMKMDTHEQWTQRLPSSHVPSIPGSTKDCAFNKIPFFSNIFIFILSWQFGSEEKDCEVSAVCRRLRTSGGGKKMWSHRFLKISYRLCSQSSGRCQLTFSVSLCLRALQQNTYFKSDTLKNHLMNEFVSWEKYRTNLLPLLNPTDWPVNLFRFVIPEL